MKKKSTLMWSILLILLLASFVIAAQIDISEARKSNITVSTWIHKSDGVRDADRTTIIVQKAKIKKNKEQIKQAKTNVDPEKAPEMLSVIDKKKMENYKIMNSALLDQKNIYEALANNTCDQKKLDNFKTKSDNARVSLKQLKTLTDEQVRIYKATTKDEQAIKVANSNYYTWESAMDGLSSDPIEGSKLAALDKKIQSGSETGVNGASEQAKSIVTSDLYAEDKSVLENEILADGANVQNDMQNTMMEMENAFKEIIKVLQAVTGDTGGSGNPMSKIGSMIGGGSAPKIDTSILQSMQAMFSLMANQMIGFSDSFGGFMQSTGTLAGVKVQAAPKLKVPVFGL